jgi:hypothetical protein
MEGKHVMTNKIISSIKEAAGYVEEETGETFKDKEMAEKGRERRNEARVEKGKMPKLTEPGEGDKD